MGQRLVITVQKNQTEIAKLYFHWSAYSVDALAETKSLINFVKNHPEYTDLRLACIRFVEARGGGICGGYGSGNAEYQAICKMFPNETFGGQCSRNDGLIAITPQKMIELQGASEGDITIDFDSKTVLNWVNWTHDSLDPAEDKKTIIEVPFNFGEIDFDKIDYAFWAAKEATSIGGVILDKEDIYFEMIY